MPGSPIDPTAPRSARELISVVRALRSNLRDVDRALAKMDAGTYGTMRALRASDRRRATRGLPWAMLCIDCKQEGVRRPRDQGGGSCRGCWWSSATPGASATRPTPRPTATRAPTRSGTPRSAVGGLDVPALESLGLGLLTGIEGVDATRRAGNRPWPRDGAFRRQGHDDRALGDDGHPARRALPPVPGRVPAGDRGAVRASDRAADPRQRARLGHGDHRPARARAHGDRRARSCTRAATPSSRSRATRPSCRWSSSTSGAASRAACSSGPHRVGRVIARPFEGEPGAFVRSPERRDLSVPPPGPTVLDALSAAGVPVCGVGKIRDIFDGQGIGEAAYSDSNAHGVDLTIEYLRRPGAGVRVHEPRRLRLEVRPSERPGGLRRARSRRSIGVCPSCSRPSTAGSC